LRQVTGEIVGAELVRGVEPIVAQVGRPGFEQRPVAQREVVVSSADFEE
jgi:hypothetical protein